MDSIRNQTVQPCDVVVVDDGSTDSTVSMVEEFSRKYSYPIKIHSCGVNMGIGVARQKGAKLAKSKYVAYLSSDDVYASNFIEQSVPYLNKNTATFTAYHQCNSQLEPQAIFHPPQFSKASVLHWALQKNMYVNFSSIIVPRRIFELISFEGTLRHGEDLIFLLDSVNAGLDWRLIDAPLLCYRMHSQAGTYTQKPEEFELLWRYLRLRLKRVGCHEKTIERSYRQSRGNACMSWHRKIIYKTYRKIYCLLNIKGKI